MQYKQYHSLPKQYIKNKVKEFLKEDMVVNDLTTISTIKKPKKIIAKIYALEELAFVGSQILPYFLNYNPQKNFYYAVENTNFEVNPEGRTDGTYTKYQSLDDKIDGLHYYTWYIKTGRGRATEDSALEVRNNIITRDEAVSLVKQYDGELPKTYFKDILNYLSISEKKFFEIIDKFRSPHLWEKRKNKWYLKQAVWMLNK